MRLKSIKLTGFKSFVDATTIPFPHNLSAIVGPNGCGKSNVIDAVRWVMGESSAKHLRGESMADVIFNGSNARKPLGQASVELIFDNASGRVIGEYGAYAEIAIKRLVTREGQSIYFLNNTRCRRKDITDIFLGTGLGPRSYAIIGQGMISRLIDAKPDELRVFIEEAAGISKYKERRRDTENRIRRTRENLERLTDLRDELERQLTKLQQQSAAAVKYKELKEQERAYQAQLQAIRWRELDNAMANKSALIRELELQVEACVTDRVAADSQIEQLRIQQGEANAKVNDAQSDFYSVGARIATIEQQIQHQKERQQQLSEDLAHIQQSRTQVEEDLEKDRQAFETLQAELIVSEPELEVLTEKAEASSEALAIAEERMRDWQTDWDCFNEEAQEASQNAQLLQSKIQHLDDSVERLIHRIDRLEQERVQLDTTVLAQEIEMIDAKLSESEQHFETVEQRAEQLLNEVGAQREQNNLWNEQLHEKREHLQQLRGRESSLQVLQQAALGREAGQESDWLAAHQLANAKRLAELIRLKPGDEAQQWLAAIEVVLGDYLQAVCVTDHLDRLEAGLAEFDQGRLNFVFNPQQVSQTNEGSMQPIGMEALVPLTQYVEGPEAVLSLLQGVYVTTSLQQALGLRDQLRSGMSLITPEGIWIGANWLRISKAHDEQSGVIARKHELEVLEQEVIATEAIESELMSQLSAGRERLLNLEGDREEVQQTLQQATIAQSDLKSQHSAKNARFEQMRLRGGRIESEIVECIEHRDQETQEIKEARAELQIALEQMATHEDRRETLSQQRDENRDALEEARPAAQQDRQAAHTLTVQVETARTQRDSLQAGIIRLETQHEMLAEKQSLLLEKSEANTNPEDNLTDELATLLNQRIRFEEALTEAKEVLESIDTQLRFEEKRRDEADRTSQSVRTHLEAERLDSKALQVKSAALKEQLDEGEYEIPTLLAGLPEEADPQEWEAQLTSIANRVSRLGAINLAAIEEYDQQKERKVYLDEQNADLEEALDTLESAIRKIDKETRERFKETFDKVNNGLKALFPKVFGGGSAYLELTGEDLLDTGVAIMARPPGKKNSTIHLLSGGEKALTAIALVFSIFQLNPAPFCMLDEVDAPLDDANVGRYSRLLKEMSEHVQFIYITHNKIAMEISEQLMGVTMHEAGVSRLVAVDVNEAAELAVV